jgi:hypothetical protein
VVLSLSLIPSSDSGGQRKLLIAEIEFLNDVARDGDTVVYAGAACGTHITLLSDRFFPFLRFELYDPRPFTIAPSARVRITAGMFTDETARGFSGRDDVLFISDIRNEPNDEATVARDMAEQMRWHGLMAPRWSLLKFRLPWTPGCTPYVAGDVYLQAYSPTQSTETRLRVARDAAVVVWDNQSCGRRHRSARAAAACLTHSGAQVLGALLLVQHGAARGVVPP